MFVQMEENRDIIILIIQNSPKSTCVLTTPYICDNDNYESILYGVYSTEQLAREAAEELLELGNIHHYEIECPKLDEFGWR